jgi:hypothetical protein
VQCHVSQHYADRDYLYQLLREDNRWVCRDFQNPVTARHGSHPEFVETFRRIALEPVPDVAAALSPVWEPFAKSHDSSKEGES